jgi:AraC family transcriptional regulator
MNDDLHQGLAVYHGELAEAGGRALQAHQHPQDALAVVMYASPPYDIQVPPMNVARLSILLSPARVAGGLDGDPAQSFETRRHSVFLTPAGAGAAWHKTSNSRHINIYFQPQSFEQKADAGWGSVLSDGVPLLNAGIPGAGPLFDMLAAELGQGHPFAAEAVDSLARLVLVRLARHQARRTVHANPLTPALRARLTEFIQARLDQRLMVSDMAAIVGLSPNRFAQAFTRALGQPPHQYVLQMRVERALHLLHHSSHGLADIAAACGFASQQHMTKVMRRRLGTPPGRQRAASTKDVRR